MRLSAIFLGLLLATGSAWAEWLKVGLHPVRRITLIFNDTMKGSKPISCAELVQRTGVKFLPVVVE